MFEEKSSITKNGEHAREYDSNLPIFSVFFKIWAVCQGVERDFLISNQVWQFIRDIRKASNTYAGRRNLAKKKQNKCNTVFRNFNVATVLLFLHNKHDSIC